MINKRMIQFIQSRTRTDFDGCRKYRDDHGTWRKLRTPEDFKALNKILDRVRPEFERLEKYYAA